MYIYRVSISMFMFSQCFIREHLNNKGYTIIKGWPSHWVHYCLLPLCWKAFSENTTPHQQHWANSVQKSPGNHLFEIGWQLPKRCVMLIVTSLEIQRESLCKGWIQWQWKTAADEEWYSSKRCLLPLLCCVHCCLLPLCFQHNGSKQQELNTKVSALFDSIFHSS